MDGIHELHYIHQSLSNNIIFLNIFLFSVLEVYSDQRGLQFYTGGHLPPQIISEYSENYDLLEDVNICTSLALE